MCITFIGQNRYRLKKAQKTMYLINIELKAVQKHKNSGKDRAMAELIKAYKELLNYIQHGNIGAQGQAPFPTVVLL